MSIEILPLTGVEKMFKPQRPISETDRLAREFAYNPSNRKEFMGMMFSLNIMGNFSDWTTFKKFDESSVKDKSLLDNYRYFSWNPQIVKYDQRWVIQVVGTQHLFGVDALNIGLNNAIHFKNWHGYRGDKYMLAYIHFGKPVWGNPKSEKFQKEHSIDSVDFDIFTREQVSDLRTIVDSILAEEQPRTPQTQT